MNTAPAPDLQQPPDYRLAEDVLLLAFYFSPQITSGVQRAARFRKFLPAHGYNVHTICSSHGGTLDLPGVRYVPDANAKVSSLQTWLAAKLQRIAPYNEQLPWVPHAVAAASKLIRDGLVSAIVSTSPPVATHAAAFLLKRKFPHLKWIADFRDPIAGNPNRSRRWALGYDRWLERSIFSEADAVIGVTDAVVDGWRARYPRCAGKLHLIWNGFDPEEVPERRQPPARTTKTLAHIGVIYFARHPNLIVDSLERLIRAGRLDPGAVRLRQIGPVEGGDVFTARPSTSYLDELGCLEIVPRAIPRDDALQETAASDYLLLLDIGDLDNQAYTVPAKIFDYILTGRPILAVTPSNGPVERILRGSGIRSTIVHLDDPGAEVDRKLEAFFSSSTAPSEPSPWFFQTFDGDRQTEAVSNILRDLSKPRGSR